MKKLFSLLLLLLLPSSVFAAGTLVCTTTSTFVTMTYSCTWTSTAGGAVSANPIAVTAGTLVQVKFKPGTSGTQPTDMYDVTLLDSDSVDLLAGNGANLSNAANSYWIPTAKPVLTSTTQNLDLVVANAGSAKTGTVIFTIRLLGRD